MHFLIEGYSQTEVEGQRSLAPATTHLLQLNIDHILHWPPRWKLQRSNGRNNGAELDLLK